MCFTHLLIIASCTSVHPFRLAFIHEILPYFRESLRGSLNVFTNLFISSSLLKDSLAEIVFWVQTYFLLLHLAFLLRSLIHIPFR